MTRPRRNALSWLLNNPGRLSLVLVSLFALAADLWVLAPTPGMEALSTEVPPADPSTEEEESTEADLLKHKLRARHASARAPSEFRKQPTVPTFRAPLNPSRPPLLSHFSAWRIIYALRC